MGLVRGNLISNRLESKGCRGVVCGDFGVGLASQTRGCGCTVEMPRLMLLSLSPLNECGPGPRLAGPTFEICGY